MRNSIVLLGITFAISLFGQQNDSLQTADSLKSKPNFGLYPKPLISPLKPSFGIKAPNKYDSGLMLGKPYTPKTDIQRMDLRQSQFYTPYLTKKMHLIDMGRDPGTFWLSPYTVAFLGLAMLERYYLHEHFVEMFSSKYLLPEQIIEGEKYWEILDALWVQEPQTLGELEKNPAVGFRLRGKELETALALLQKNGLIRSELLPNKTQQYYPLYKKGKLKTLVVRMLDNPDNSDLSTRDGLNKVYSHFVKK